VSYSLPVPDEAYKVAYDESVRMLTQQGSALDNLRTRAGTLVAAASLVTTFVGAQAFAKPSLTKGDHGFVLVTQKLDIWGWLAIAALVGVLVCSLVVLFPRRDFIYGQSAKQLIGDLESKPPLMSLERTQRAVAMNLEENFDANEKVLRRLGNFFTAGSVLLVAETILWIVDLERVS
jgi:hypothetical protein